VPYFLGIDGGGSNTRCVLGDEKSVLGRGSGSGCNVLRVGEACARDSLSGAIHEACVQAGVSPQQVARTCAGISGAADDGIASTVQRILTGVVGGAIEVIGDMEIALESGFGGGPGVIVIAGTGSIVYGRNAQGETARAGGGGRLISDEGSGHWCVVRALGAALRAHDQGRDSELLQRLLAAFSVRTVPDLIVEVNADPGRDLASLYPVVLAAADAGDPIAAAVLEQAGSELAKLAEVVIRRLFREDEEVPFGEHGGVFASSARVREAFEEALQASCSRLRLLRREIDPALGALDRARRDFGSRWLYGVSRFQP